jgi:hypothetical protein
MPARRHAKPRSTGRPAPRPRARLAGSPRRAGGERLRHSWWTLNLISAGMALSGQPILRSSARSPWAAFRLGHTEPGGGLLEVNEVRPKAWAIDTEAPHNWRRQGLQGAHQR